MAQPGDRVPATAPEREPGRFRPSAEPRAFREPDSATRPSTEPSSNALAVIPCLNEADHIEALIRHLLDDPDWPDPLVVVADGGSTDGSREIVSRMAVQDRRVRLLHNPGRLQSAGVNLAARTFGAGRRWMVRVDAHADYPPRYVSRLMAEAERTGAASVVVAMHTRGRGGFQSAAAVAQNCLLGAGGAPHRMAGRAGWVDHGHHALLGLDSFLAVGGYDETFSHNEDAEFDVRLARAAGRIWLTDGLEVVYYPRATARALARQYFNYGRGRARTLRQHRLRPKLRQLALLPVAPAVALAPFGLGAPAAAAPAALWAGAAVAYGLVLAARRRRLSDSACSLAAMVMHLAWSAGFWSELLTRRRPRGEASGAYAAAVRS